MPIIAVALMAALTGAPTQDEAPRTETRAEVRIISTGDGPGRIDADGDGVVTREEFTAPMGAAFDRLDTDRDGRLSAAEMAAGHAGPDGEGRAVFMMGGPGGPDSPGVHVFTSRIRREGGSGDGPPVIIHEGRPGGDAEVFSFRSGGPDGGPGNHQIFVRRFGGPGSMDKDGDGKVSQEEFLAPMRDAFQRMDADSDGFLDKGEDAPPPPPAR